MPQLLLFQFSMLWTPINVRVSTDTCGWVTPLTFPSTQRCPTSQPPSSTQLEELWALQFNRCTFDWNFIRVLSTLLPTGTGWSSAVQVVLMDRGCSRFYVSGVGRLICMRNYVLEG